MRHHATLLFPFSPATARAIHGALRPEIASEVPKTTGRVRLDDESVCVELDAEDLASLRAAVNSYLRWVDAAEKAARLGGVR